MRRGEVTLGLRYFGDDRGELISRIIGEETMLVVCSPEHRLAGKRARQIDLRGERWIGFPAARGREMLRSHPRAPLDCCRARRDPGDAHRQPHGAETTGRSGVRYCARAGEQRSRRAAARLPQEDRCTGHSDHGSYRHHSKAKGTSQSGCACLDCIAFRTVEPHRTEISCSDQPIEVIEVADTPAHIGSRRAGSSDFLSYVRCC